MLRIIILGFATLAIAALARRSERSWEAPTAFFAIVWGCYLLSALAFINDADRILNGMMWIWLSVCVMYLGTLAGHPFVRDATEAPVGDAESVRGLRGRLSLRWLSILSVGVGFSLVVIDVFARGYSIRDLISFAALAQVSAANRAELYGGEVETSLARRICFIVMFMGTLYGGTLFRISRRTSDRILAAATLFAVSLVYTLSGSRMGVLYGGAFWLASYIAVHIYLTSGRDRTGRLVLGLGAAGAVVILGLSTLTQVVRYAATQDLDWFRMLADPFSFLAAFGIWFDDTGLRFGDLYYGGRTFRRIFEFVGVAYELQPAIDVGFTSSNIYTVFRDLLEDFGSIGALGMMFLLGLASRVAFVAVAARRSNAVPWLTLLYAFTITSFASGMLSYTTPTAAIVLFGLSFPLLRPLAGALTAQATKEAEAT